MKLKKIIAGVAICLSAVTICSCSSKGGIDIIEDPTGGNSNTPANTDTGNTTPGGSETPSGGSSDTGNNTNSGSSTDGSGSGTSTGGGSAVSPAITPEIQAGYVAIKDTFEMNDTITDSFYKGTMKSVEQLYVETVDNCNDTIVDLYVKTQSGSGQGSGVLFGWDKTNGLSYILTCYHMIEGVTECTAKDVNGTEYSAMIVCGYSDQDLAVIAIKTPTDHTLKYASLLDRSLSVYTGQTAIAIGNNDGYSHSASDGIVSYANRAWCTSLYYYKTLNQLQITTEINGGNSGGGLFSTSGALIGITNAGVETSSSGASIEGVKFAVSYQEMWTVIDGFTQTASYNPTINDFDEGYIPGDFELGSSFNITTYGNMWKYEYVIYVKQAATSNDTYSDYQAFTSGDIITAYTIDYKDSAKEDKVVKFTNPTSLYDFYFNLYNSNVSLDDSIVFSVQRYNSTTRAYDETTVTITISQFTYRA